MISFLSFSCLLLGKARLYTDRAGGQGQYKSKCTINGVNGIHEPATEAVSTGNAKPFRAKLRTLLMYI